MVSAKPWFCHDGSSPIGEVSRQRLRLEDPEPCGEPGMVYDAFLQAARNMVRSVCSVRVCLCDKHKAKALREGKELRSA
jgi:hypothetical protein